MIRWTACKLFEKKFILAAILEFSVYAKLWDFLSDQKSSCELTRLEQRSLDYYEKVVFVPILENGRLQNSAMLDELPPYTSLFYESLRFKKIWHTSSSLELPRDSLCSWTKPRNAYVDGNYFHHFVLTHEFSSHKWKWGIITKWFFKLYENVLALS